MTKTKIQNIRLIRFHSWFCMVMGGLVFLGSVLNRLQGKKEDTTLLIFFLFTMGILASALQYIAKELDELKQKIDPKQ